MVVISDYRMIREMFSKSTFSGRIDFSIFDFALDGNLHGNKNCIRMQNGFQSFKFDFTRWDNFFYIFKGLINTEGPHWQELRQFTIRQLRDFGFGKKSMEELIMVEVNELIANLRETKGTPITNVKDKFFVAVVNALWFIVAGVRDNQNDPKLITVINKSNKYNWSFTFNQFATRGN